MLLTLERKYKKEAYTIGKLYIDGEYICDTLEDKDRGLRQDMSLEEINEIKVYGETAIPTGTYVIDMNNYSSKFGKKSFYVELCGGKLPLLVDVPGFNGIRIHAGNTNKDTLGCILPGYNKAVGKVLSSRAAFTKLYQRMQVEYFCGNEIKIEIK